MQLRLTPKACISNAIAVPRCSSNTRTSAGLWLIWLVLLCCPLIGTSSVKATSRHFDLPAESADASLKRFSEQSGVDVIFATRVAVGVKTNAVKGEFPPLEAISRLLAGTGLVPVLDETNGALTVSRTNPQTMSTKPSNLPTRLRQALLSVLFIFSSTLPAQVPSGSQGTSAEATPSANKSETSPDKTEVVRLSPFEVKSGTNEGYIASETLSGSRVAAKIFDVPASVSIVTRDLLDDMGAVDPWQALSKSVPAVTTYGAPGVFSGATIRGFRSQFWAVDGATSASVGPISNFNLDGLEVIKGPSALLYGPFGAYGGYINMMPKWARRSPINKLEVSVGTDSFYSGMIDVGYEFLKDDRLQLRLVLGELNYDRPGFKGDYTHSFVFAPSLTYDISPKVKLKTRAEYNLRDYRISNVPLDANGVPIRGLIASNYFPGSHSEDQEFSTQTVLTGTLSDEWSFKFQFVTEIDHPKSWLGGFTGRTALVTPTDDTAKIYNSHGDYFFKQWTIDMSVAWDAVDFAPGFSNHLVTGFTMNNWTDVYRWNANTSMAGLYPQYQQAPWTTFSISNPPPVGGTLSSAMAITQNNLYQPYATQWLGGVMGTDTLEMFNGKLKFNLGTRYNYDERYGWNKTQSVANAGLAGNPSPSKVNTIFLWRYGAVYQPTKNIGFYFGHDEGYLAVGNIFKVDGSTLLPESGKNDEFGLKLDNFHALAGNFYGSIAYFKLSVVNKWRGDPYNAGFFIQDGLQHNNGWDAQLGYNSDNRKLSAILGFYNADGPTAITGARASFVPKQTFNFWVRYNLTPRFAVGGGYKHQGDSIDGTGLLKAPAFGSTDLFMEYAQKLSGRRQINYRLGMTNVSDGLNMYFLSNAVAANLEDGRQAKLTATYMW
jgi:outer membrane receptor protein involved in Fe transport